MRISPISVIRNNFYSAKKNTIQNNYNSTPANTNVSFMGTFSLADINATILNSNFEQQKNEVITLLNEMNGILDTTKKEIVSVEQQKNEEGKKTYDEALGIIDEVNELLKDGTPINRKKLSTINAKEQVFEIELSDSSTIKEIQILNSNKGDINRIVLENDKPSFVFRDYKRKGNKESFSQKISYSGPYSIFSILEGVSKSIDSVGIFDSEYFSKVDRQYYFNAKTSQNDEDENRLRKIKINENGNEYANQNHSCDKCVFLDRKGKLETIIEGKKNDFCDRVVEFEDGEPISYTKGKQPSTIHNDGFDSQIIIEQIPYSKGYNAVYTKNYSYEVYGSRFVNKNSSIGSKIKIYLGEKD